LLVSVVLSLCLLIPTNIQALNIDLSFTGSSLTSSGFIPPDTMGAVGPNEFVELLNGQYSVYRKSDGVRLQTNTLNGFWQNAGVVPAGSFAFDPRAVYDPSTQRWFAASVDNSFAPNNILIAVSKSANPTDGWTGFAIPSDSDKSHWADFPTLGVNSKGVFVAANMFPLTGGGQNTSVLVVPKADLLAGTVANRTLFENIPNTGFSLQPAVGDASVSGSTVSILLSAFNTAGGQFKRSDIVGSVTLPLLDPTDKFIAVPAFSGPPNALQPGTKLPLEVLDSRISSNVVI